MWPEPCDSGKQKDYRPHPSQLFTRKWLPAKNHFPLWLRKDSGMPACYIWQNQAQTLHISLFCPINIVLAKNFIWISLCCGKTWMNFLANPIISWTILSSLMKGNKILVNKTWLRFSPSLRPLNFSLPSAWASVQPLLKGCSEKTGWPQHEIVFLSNYNQITPRF